MGQENNSEKAAGKRVSRKKIPDAWSKPGGGKEEAPYHAPFVVEKSQRLKTAGPAM